MAGWLIALSLIGFAPGSGDPFSRLDKDGDGQISKDEAPPRIHERFEKIDTDGDGFISREELRAAIRKRRQNRQQHPPGTPPGPQ